MVDIIEYNSFPIRGKVVDLEAIETASERAETAAETADAAAETAGNAANNANNAAETANTAADAANAAAEAATVVTGPFFILDERTAKTYNCSIAIQASGKPVMLYDEVN